jgi:hypothetical protein
MEQVKEIRRATPKDISLIKKRPAYYHRCSKKTRNEIDTSLGIKNLNVILTPKQRDEIHLHFNPIVYRG